MTEPFPQTADNRKCVIHIGLPRTGTKLLQWHLFSRHSQVAYLGMYIGRIARGYRRFDLCRDATVQAVMQEIAFGDVSRPDLVGCRRLANELLPPAFGQGRVPVWSWESLATDAWSMRRARAEHLREVFGDCRIVATIRHPLDLLHSAYFQILRRENVARPHKLQRILRARCYPIEEWLERQFDGEVMQHLEYARTIRLYADLFGRQSIKVLMFEDLKAAPAAFVEALCRFMGIDPVEGIGLTEGNRENSRWTIEQYETLKSIQGSFLRSMYFRFIGNRRRRHMIGMTPTSRSGDRRPACVEIPPAWRSRIEEATREGNRWLADEWSLPLAQHGYPL